MKKQKEQIPIYLDTTPNALLHPSAREQIAEQIKQRLIEQIPNIIDREKKIKAFMTDELGEYLNLLVEAKQVYKLGYHHSAIAMVGVAAERFSIELASKLRFKVNNISISQKEIFDRDINQYKRLRLLKKSGLLEKVAFERLDKIRDIRNKYIHPKAKINPENDSVILLNLMIETLSERFSKKYSIRDGKLVKNKVKFMETI